MYYYCYFIAHQHKATGLKIKLSKIKMVATASYSVTTVLWKETAFLIIIIIIIMIIMLSCVNVIQLHVVL